MRDCSGKVIVSVYAPSTDVYRWDYEVDEYEGAGSEYINEGVGWDYFLDLIDEIKDRGRYLIEFSVSCYAPRDIYDQADEDYNIDLVKSVSSDYCLEQENNTTSCLGGCGASVAPDQGYCDECFKQMEDEGYFSPDEMYENVD